MARSYAGRWSLILVKPCRESPHFHKIDYPSSEEEIYLEYDIAFETTGVIELQLLLAPTLNFNDNKGLRYEVSFGKEAPRQVNFNGHYRGELGRWQAEHIIRSTTQHTISEPGIHTLRFRGAGSRYRATENSDRYRRFKTQLSRSNGKQS